MLGILHVLGLAKFATVLAGLTLATATMLVPGWTARTVTPAAAPPVVAEAVADQLRDRDRLQDCTTACDPDRDRDRDRDRDGIGSASSSPAPSAAPGPARERAGAGSGAGTQTQARTQEQAQARTQSPSPTCSPSPVGDGLQDRNRQGKGH